jgi:hypothetical protein
LQLLTSHGIELGWPRIEGRETRLFFGVGQQRQGSPRWLELRHGRHTGKLGSLGDTMHVFLNPILWAVRQHVKAVS